MLRDNRNRVAGNLALMMLGIALCTHTALAQGQGRRGGQNGQGRSAMGQGMRSSNGQNQANGQTSSSMGQGGMNQGGGNQMPGVRGTIVAGDINTGQILIESPWDGTQRIVQVTSDTQIFTTQSTSNQTADQTTTNATQTQGRMRGNAGSAATMGQRPAPPQGGNANQSRRGGQGGGQRGMQSNSSTNQSSGGSDGSMPPPPPEMNLQQITFSDLKVGDRMMAMGQINSNGVFVAARIGVNLDMGKSQGGQGGQNTQQNAMSQGGGRGMSRAAQGGGTNNSATSGRRPGGRPRN